MTHTTRPDEPNRPRPAALPRYAGAVAIIAALAMATLVACGTGNSAQDPTGEPMGGQRLGPGSAYEVPANPDIQTYFRTLQDRADAVARTPLSNDLVEYLPNQRFIVDDRAPRALSKGVVVGEVTEVLPGAAFTTDDDTVDLGTRVDFADPSADYRIAIVRINVDHWFGEHAEPAFVEVGAFIPHPAGTLGDAEINGLRALGKILVVLDADRTYDWDPEVRVIASSGLLLGDIDSRGTIGFPALGMSSGDFVGGATVASLAAAWRSTPAPIRIHEDHETGVLSRE